MTSRTITTMIAATLAAGALTTTPSLAATIQVTTKLDTVADDGFCSLREAVSAANSQTASGNTPGECAAGDADPEIDVIQVPRGKYRLTRGFPREDLNDGGDLDVTGSVLIEGAGARRTTIENALGDRRTPGDGDRLFHVDPGFTGEPAVVFRGLGLKGGDVGCVGTGCLAGASAVEISGGDVDFEHCLVTKNAATCVGIACGTPLHTAAIRGLGLGSLRLADTVVEKNRTQCSDFACRTGSAGVAMGADEPKLGGAFTLNRTTLRKNVASCDGPSCLAGPIVRSRTDEAFVIDTTIARNATHCSTEQCQTTHLLDLFSRTDVSVLGSEIDRNAATCEGAECSVDHGMRMKAEAAVRIQHSVLAKNRAGCTGHKCETESLIDLIADDSTGTLSLEHVTLTRNEVRCTGELCNIDSVLEGDGNHILVWDSALTKNRTTCRGIYCDADEILFLRSGNSDIFFRRTTFERNASTCGATDCELDDLVDLRSGADLGLLDVLVQRNELRCTGLDCETGWGWHLSADVAVIMRRSEFRKNRVSCRGESCVVENPMRLAGNEDSEISNGTFLQNETACTGSGCQTGSGGAFSNHTDRLTVVDTRFEKNTAGDQAGAIFNGAKAELLLDNVRMHDNRTPGRGGAVYNDHNGPDQALLAISDSTISDNVAGADGGGVYNRGIITTFENATLVDNTPNGTDCVNVGTGTGCPAP